MKIIWLKFFVLSLLSIFACCQKKIPQQIPPVPVSAILVEPQTIPADFEYVGIGESSHIVELRARVEGYLEKISYDEGGFVPKGQLMFVLDKRPFIDTLKSREGDLARKEAILWDAKQKTARMVPLYQQNAVSKKDLDDAIAEELSAKANVITAKAEVASAELNLSFASIEAPVSGMADQAKFREGALISPGPNSLLTTMYVIDPIWVNFSVSEGDILKSRHEVERGLLKYPEGMNFKIEIIMADGTIFPAEGKIDFLDPALQQSTGTMLARAIVSNPKGWIRPGQFVRVIVKGAIRPRALIVPQTAVAQGQHGIYVYVINKENQAEIRPIEPGDWYGDYWIVDKGLEAGDKVIVQGINRVQNQTPVQIKKWVSQLPSESSLKKKGLGF